MCLAGVLAVSPIISFAQGHKLVAEAENKEFKPMYSSYEGIIKTVNNKDGRMSILVDGLDKNKTSQLIFHINDKVSVFDTKLTKENKIMHLKEGAEVSVFYPVNTPMALSNPGQLTPEVVVVKNTDTPTMVKVDKFDENLLSSDGQLKLNVTEPKPYESKTLVVFYGATTKSIPAQAAPKTIIVLDADKVEGDKDKKLEETKIDKGEKVVDGETHIVVMDKIKINDKVYKTAMYRKSKDVVMVPLRDVAELMGFEVKWQGKEKPIEVVKGPLWSAIEIGKNRYTYAKVAPFILESAPELKNGTTYVPVTYIQKVLGANSLKVVDGVLEVR